MSASDMGVWLSPPDGRRWRFDPGSLSLAFGFTGDFGFHVPEWETLHSTADLDQWFIGRFGPMRTMSSEADRLSALQLRAAITSSARRAAAGRALVPEAVDELNDWAARPAISPHLSGGLRLASRPDAARALSTVAHDAIATFAGSSGVIRECTADDCRLIFLDTSRPRNRRWCSMSRCGGRAKVRAHYARHSRGREP